MHDPDDGRPSAAGPSDRTGKTAALHAWSTGRYPSLVPNLLPAIVRLVHPPASTRATG